jgi:AraC-like DNA-binding protein
MAQSAGMTLTSEGELLADGRVVRRFRPAQNDMIADVDYFDILDIARDFTGDDVALLTAYADQVQTDHLGVLGLAIKTAPNLRESLQRVERYYRLVTDTAVYRLCETGVSASLIFEPQSAHNATLEFRNEGALAGFAQNMRRFVGSDLAFEFVSFRHACRSDPARYAELFGCPVRFEADRDTITMHATMLDLPNRLGDAAVSEFVTEHLEAEFGSLQDGASLVETLMHHLTPTLSNGRPQAAVIARDMGLSERTLYRRLAEEGLTFRDVVGRAQLALAQEMLRTSDVSIAEVAFLTGFSEQSTFSRAFKRWVGQAPAQFRQQQASNV